MWMTEDMWRVLFFPGKGRKSKREIFAELSRKQVDEAIVDEMMERCYDAEDSGEAIRRFLKKRHYDPEQATMEEKQKVYAYLARRAFPTGRSKR